MHKKNRDEHRQVLGMNAVLSIALLFLSVVMIKSAFSQLFANRIVDGCINAVGGLLFFGVSMTLLRDLCVYLRDKETIQEDSTHGHERHE